MKLRRATGFTLLEVMVVILIIGISVSVVLMNMSSQPDYGEQLQKDALRFQTVVNMASDYAVLNQLQLGIRIDDHQYRFMLLDEKQQWQYARGEQLLQSVSIDAPFHLELSLDNLPWQQDTNLLNDKLFDHKLSLEKDLQQDEQKKRPDPPQIWILSSGEVTPFSLVFAFEPDYGSARPAYFRINSKGTAPVALEGPLERL